MKTAKIAKLIYTTVLIICLLMQFTFASPIDDKKNQLTDIEAQLDSLNIKQEKAVEDYNNSISNLSVVKKKLKSNQLKIVDKKIDIKDKKNILGSRMRSIYKDDSLSVISMLLKVKDYNQLIDSLYLINRIAQSDNSLISGLNKSKLNLESIQKTLDRQKEQKEILVNKVAATKYEIENAIEEKGKVLNSVKKDLKKLQEEEREKIRKMREEALRKLKEEQEQVVNQPQGDYTGGNTSSSNVVEIGKKYLGVRYTWGGTSPETGFDCSGFVWYVYGQVGVTLPRTSSQQHLFLASSSRLVSESNLQPGDLIFYGRGSVTDVKMYMGSGYIIGANGGRYTRGEVRILPLHYRSDFFAAGRP